MLIICCSLLTITFLLFIFNSSPLNVCWPNKIIMIITKNNNNNNNTNNNNNNNSNERT